MIYPCLRNLEHACSKHERGGQEKPPGLELLALARGGTDPFAFPQDDDKADFDIEELDVDGVWRPASDHETPTLNLETTELMLASSG